MVRETYCFILEAVQLTTRVVTGCEEDATGCLPNTDDMAGSRSTENAILADEQLLDTICSPNLCNKLDDLWVPVSAVTTNDKEGTLYTFRDGQENGGDEGFAVMILLEDGDLFAKS